VVILFALPPSTARADLLDPLDFASLGTLNLAGGSFTIDTDALTIVDDTDPNIPLFTGVIDDQDETADFLNGVWVPGSVGIPQIAVFTFADVNLASTASITVTGTRALAFLSHGNVLIDTTIDLRGEDVPSFPIGTPAPAGTARFGGFGGGVPGVGEPTGSGDGPGGGGPDGIYGGPAGFGGPGGPSQLLTEGPAYGDLVNGPLQGGSGGGSASSTLGGAAGGGALEISATGGVTLAANGKLFASGGKSNFATGSGSLRPGGGPGSGGGIRIQGQSVDLLGSVNAIAHEFEGGVRTYGGGGRVAVFGLNQLFDFIVGVTSTSSINTSKINVEGGSASVSTRGLISVVPQVTSIPSGQSLTLGSVTDLSDANRRLELRHHNIRVQQGGQAVVPAEGYANSGKIELFPGGSRVTGPGILTNRSELSGTGTVEVPVVNDPGGTIDAINDVLTFTASVTNEAGGQINAINSTLAFQAGLTNDGEMNLINATILGSVTDAAGSAANFVGDNSVSGSLMMATGDSLAIRLGGTSPQLSDSLSIGGNASLAGALGVSLQSGFTLAPSQSFTIVDVGGTASGNFAGFGEGALVGTFGGTELFITYTGGNGNDVALFAQAPVLPGDYNQNGVVDAADYTVWRDNLGGLTALPNDDTSGVGTDDYTRWKNNFGQTLGSGAGATGSTTATASVPEPPTVGLLLGLFAVFTTRCGANRR
jgi:hypothetical protein